MPNVRLRAATPTKKEYNQLPGCLLLNKSKRMAGGRGAGVLRWRAIDSGEGIHICDGSGVHSMVCHNSRELVHAMQLRYQSTWKRVAAVSRDVSWVVRASFMIKGISTPWGIAVGLVPKNISLCESSCLPWSSDSDIPWGVIWCSGGQILDIASENRLVYETPSWSNTDTLSLSLEIVTGTVQFVINNQIIYTHRSNSIPHTFNSPAGIVAFIQDREVSIDLVNDKDTLCLSDNVSVPLRRTFKTDHGWRRQIAASAGKSRPVLAQIKINSEDNPLDVNSEIEQTMLLSLYPRTCRKTSPEVCKKFYFDLLRGITK